MKYEDKKIVAVLATNVDAKTAMNVIGHLAISIGKYSDNEIMGKKELIDNSGISHLGISKFPFIVTKVKASKLKNTINLAKQNTDIMIADYPKYNKKYIFGEEEVVVDDSIEFIKSFRNVKKENNITKDMKVLFDTTDSNDLIVKMLKLDEKIVKKPLGINAYKVFSNRIKATIFFEKEEDDSRNDDIIKELKESIERREKLLANENYVTKAPKNVVDMDRKKLKEEKEKLKVLLK